MSEQRRLLRARDSRMVGGVCMGLAHYIGVDVVFIRLAFVLLALNGLGVAVYFILWILIPDDAHGELTTEAAVNANVQDIGDQFRSMGQSVGTPRGAMVVGLVLIVVGAVLLGSHFFPFISFALLWPLGLIGLGVLMLVRRR
jgi:phage shock protein C